MTPEEDVEARVELLGGMAEPRCRSGAGHEYIGQPPLR
jgi:hypothetical protein